VSGSFAIDKTCRRLRRCRWCALNINVITQTKVTKKKTEKPDNVNLRLGPRIEAEAQTKEVLALKAALPHQLPTVVVIFLLRKGREQADGMEGFHERNSIFLKLVRKSTRLKRENSKSNSMVKLSRPPSSLPFHNKIVKHKAAF